MYKKWIKVIKIEENKRQPMLKFMWKCNNKQPLQQ